MPAPDLALAERLRAAREHAGLSQGQVAKLLECQRPTISEIEGGRRKVTAEELGKFADIYGVGTEWLLGRSEVTGSLSPPLLLAARELDSLKSEDLSRVIDFLQTLKKSSDT